MENIEKLYEMWLSDGQLSKKMVRELKGMNEKAKVDAFYQNVPFGTAGMRGILGAGTNRINIFTIRRAALAFGTYLLEAFPDAKVRGVVIAHDNRHMNVEFKEETSKALRSLGIKTFLFDELKPTPLLSFAVSHLKAVGGVMITASHNPKNYNGFKVYDETGAQLTPDKIERVVVAMKKWPNPLAIQVGEVENNYALLSDDVEETYFAKVLKLQLRREQNKNGFKIVFSPQHGCGRKLGMRALNVIGYNVIPVVSQMEPDPDFSNTKNPNPEEKSAYVEAVKYAFAHQAHLIITTDPDADRLGIVIRDVNDKFMYLTGNQSAALLLDYIAKTKLEFGQKIAGKYLYTTIVTGRLGIDVAQSYGLKVKEFLTGFKYIGEQIAQDDKDGVDNYFFGYEESYGLLAAPFARDKDAIQALVLYSEMTLYYHLQGKTLDVVLDELYAKHGYYHDEQVSLAFPGAEGQAQMEKMLTNIRHNSITTLGGLKVIQTDDYLTGKSVKDGKVTAITLPQSDVLRYHFEGGTTISIRPSGTEPKCKIYFGVKASDKKSAEALFVKLHEDLSKILN